MSEVSLELFKKHVRADDFTGDDEYLQHLLDTSEEHIVGATRRTAEELRAMNGGVFPRPLAQAAMMLAGHWYNQRESASAAQMHEVPDALQALVKPWVKLADDAGGTDEI